MQHSADFTTLLAYQADIARAEREIEVRRLADERLVLTSEPATEASVSRRRQRHAQRTTRLATR
jgi:hypothetical protein